MQLYLTAQVGMLYPEYKVYNWLIPNAHSIVAFSQFIMPYFSCNCGTIFMDDLILRRLWYGWNYATTTANKKQQILRQTILKRIYSLLCTRSGFVVIEQFTLFHVVCVCLFLLIPILAVVHEWYYCSKAGR